MWYKLWKCFIHSICGTCLLIFCFSQRRSRIVLKDSENGECRSPKVKHKRKAGGSHGKQRQVEAVTLFEVVSMGRSAMQVKCGSFGFSSLSLFYNSCLIVNLVFKFITAAILYTNTHEGRRVLVYCNILFLSQQMQSGNAIIGRMSHVIVYCIVFFSDNNLHWIFLKFLKYCHYTTV